MKQTETYQLNLIEPSDVFSPDPLNQNMERAEAALEAARAEAKAADDALDARIAVLEAHKIIIGAYTGNGVQLRFVDVGHEVQAVFVQSRGMTPHFTVKDHECSPVFYVEGSGFRVGTNNTHTLNTEGRLYYYVAVV